MGAAEELDREGEVKATKEQREMMRKAASCDGPMWPSAKQLAGMLNEVLDDLDAAEKRIAELEEQITELEQPVSEW